MSMMVSCPWPTTPTLLLLLYHAAHTPKPLRECPTTCLLKVPSLEATEIARLLHDRYRQNARASAVLVLVMSTRAVSRVFATFQVAAHPSPHRQSPRRRLSPVSNVLVCHKQTALHLLSHRQSPSNSKMSLAIVECRARVPVLERTRPLPWTLNINRGTLRPTRTCPYHPPRWIHPARASILSTIQSSVKPRLAPPHWLQSIPPEVILCHQPSTRHNPRALPPPKPLPLSDSPMLLTNANNLRPPPNSSMLRPNSAPGQSLTAHPTREYRPHLPELQIVLLLQASQSPTMISQPLGSHLHLPQTSVHVLNLSAILDMNTTLQPLRKPGVHTYRSTVLAKPSLWKKRCPAS
jgi:hypothetical protein